MLICAKYHALALYFIIFSSLVLHAIKSVLSELIFMRISVIPQLTICAKTVMPSLECNSSKSMSRSSGSLLLTEICTSNLGVIDMPLFPKVYYVICVCVHGITFSGIIMLLQLPIIASLFFILIIKLSLPKMSILMSILALKLSITCNLRVMATVHRSAPKKNRSIVA